jgi:hypothetical protein
LEGIGFEGVGRYRKTFSKKRKRENMHLIYSGFKVIVIFIDNSIIGSVRDISFITNMSAFARG